MRVEARRLKRAVDGGWVSWELWGKEKIIENRLLTNPELETVSTILGRKYSRARLVRHRFYPGGRGEDTSVIFSRVFDYSEAFAGSGEVAVVGSVVKIMSAPPESLILLDEPETSLHPGAQARFLKFLLDQIKLKKHQVILSTHSPEFVDRLPSRAIKVLGEAVDGKVTITNECNPYVAFNRLQKLPVGKIRIVVEDELAKIVLCHAVMALDPGEAAAFDVQVMPGGADSIIKYHVPAAMAGKQDAYILLDGDKKKVNGFPNPQNIPVSDNATLKNLIEDVLGVYPHLSLNGGNDPALLDARYAAERDFLGWVGARVSYLPRLCPEHIVLGVLGDDSDGSKYATSASAKDALYGKLSAGVPAVGSQFIENVVAYKLAEAGVGGPDMQAIIGMLRAILSKKVGG